MKSAAQKCGATNEASNGIFVCGKPKGHKGAHVALQPNLTVAWGGQCV